MTTNQNSATIITWQAMLWRLLLTGLLLLILAGSSLTVFSAVTTRPDTQVLPTLSYEAENGGQGIDALRGR